MKFAIRDDDICFHTNASLLEEVYSPILAVCPVSFSCIPFVGGFNVDQYDEAKWALYDRQWMEWQTKEIYPLGENTEICSILKKWITENKVSIMLHGVHHDLREFCSRKSLKKEILEGKDYLEKLFSINITSISPPNNSLSREVARDIDELGMNLLIAFGHTPDERPLDFFNIKNFASYLNLYLKYKKRYRFPFPLKFKNHQEMPCYTLGPNSDIKELFEGLEWTAQQNGTFVLATHYYHLFERRELVNVMLKLIEKAKAITSNQVEFIKAEEVFV